MNASDIRSLDKAQFIIITFNRITCMINKSDIFMNDIKILTFPILTLQGAFQQETHMTVTF